MSGINVGKLFLTGKSGTIGKNFLRHSDSTYFDVTDRADTERWFRERNLFGATFLHLAALVGERQVSSDLKRAVEVNVTGTINVAKLALQKGVKRFLLLQLHTFIDHQLMQSAKSMKNSLKIPMHR